MGMLWAREDLRVPASLGPTNMHSARPVTPAQMWTTVPPAKSRTVRYWSNSPPSPDPVGHGSVDEDRPEDEEEYNRVETDALSACTEHERGSDDSEHHLEEGELQVGDLAAVHHVEFVDAVQKDVIEVTDEGSIAAERERVADDNPGYAHDRGSREALGDHRGHALPSEHASVEECDSGHHDEHERGAHKDPRDGDIDACGR